MAIFLSEADVRALITIDDAMDAVSEVFGLTAGGGVINPPRQQIDIPEGYLRLTSAIVTPMKKIAVKVSSSMVFASDSGRILLLIDSDSGRVDAIIEVFYLGTLRTAAASGVATRLMAKRDARSIGVFGSGRQARTQIEAVKAVRPIERVLAFSPNKGRLEKFCADMTARLGIPVIAAAEPEALYESDVLVTATTSKTPIVHGGHIRPGTHINAIGANRPERQEIAEDVIRLCSLIAVDSVEQAKKESSVLASAVNSGVITWDDVKDIGACMTSDNLRDRAPDAVTLYNSHGIAMEDVALATKAYELARANGVGVHVPITTA